MIKFKYFLLPLLALVFLLFSGCEFNEDDDDKENSTKQGWHFQGKDCLACHNYDLSSNRHLLIAGTLYKDSNGSNTLDNICGGALSVELIDIASPLKIYNSSNYQTANSNGAKGKGNIFILKKELSAIDNAEYIIRINSEDGYTLAQSQTAHKFSGSAYLLSNPDDSTNRNSCNACHKTNSSVLPLYVQLNKNKCK